MLHGINHNMWQICGLGADGYPLALRAAVSAVRGS
jgi:3-dehydroquinate dehydratase